MKLEMKTRRFMWWVECGENRRSGLALEPIPCGTARGSRPRRYFAAGTFSLASQLFDKHSWGSDFYDLAIIFLEAKVRQGFGLDNIA